jgi:NADH-quinone oxidoreductase subunit J
VTSFFFYYCSVVTILTALLTIVLRNPVHCGLALLTMLLHVAGFFVLLNAEFVAVVQIILYAGAILVLYLFVVMLLSLKSEEQYLHQRYGVILFVVLGICGEIFLILMKSPFSGRLGEFTADRVTELGNPHAIGLVLFNDYLLPFEIIGIFLLGAIIGAIALAKVPFQQQLRSRMGKREVEGQKSRVGRL